MSLSNRVKDSLLSALGSNEARVELVNAVDAGSSALSNILAGSNISLSLVNGQLTINASGGISGDLDLDGNSILNVDTITDPSNILTIDLTNRALVQEDGDIALNWNVGGVVLNTHIDMGGLPIIGVQDPTNPQDAATKAYVDLNSSGQILTFLSTAVGAGAADAAVTVTGLLATDTILSITQQVRGATTAAFIGWTSVVNNGFTGHWSADPGGLARLLVAVKR